MDPEAAVEMMRALSVDVRAVAVVAADGTTLAGDPGLGGRAGLLRVGRDGTAVVVDAGPLALVDLLEADARRVLAALDG